MIIGIDFGTCFSCVAFMKGALPVTDYIKDPEKTGIPTLFMYNSSTGKEEFGYDCTTGYASKHSDDVVKYIKRKIRESGDKLDSKIYSGGRVFSYSYIVRKYLQYLIAQAIAAAEKSEEFDNCKIEEITVTVPVGIDRKQMAATDYNQLIQDTVCDITGLRKSKVHILQEPVAAAVSYLDSEERRDELDGSQTILVFDLGGGTLDVTVVEYDPDNMEYDIRAKEGDLNIGGNNFDEALAKVVLRNAGASANFSDEAEERKFRNQITRAKHNLSEEEETLVSFKQNGKLYASECTREEFEKSVSDLLEKILDVISKTIESYEQTCGGNASNIDKVIMVGGGSNVPCVKRTVSGVFAKDVGERNILMHDPSKAIAKGAAVFANALHESMSTTSDSIKVNDISAHTYGFSSHNSGEDKDMIYNVLFRNTPFDNDGKIVAKSDSDFVARQDSQTVVRFTCYESDGEKGFGEDANWMDYGTTESENGMNILVPVPSEYSGRARQYSMWVTFVLNRDGILEFIIEDKDGKRCGYEKKKI